MAELKGTNEEIIKATVNEGSPLLKSTLEGITNPEVAYATLAEFPTAMNEFITTLVNRCVKTMFFNKVFNNPLRMLHRGMLGFGDSIQQIFVEMSERKGFYDHFAESGGTAENDLIGKKVPEVNVDYITQNFAHKYKVSVSQQLIRKAFLNEGGLAQMVNSLVQANTNGAYSDEYDDMKGILLNPTAEVSPVDGHQYPLGLVYQYKADADLANAFVDAGTDPHTLCEKIRAYAKKLTFKSNKYNLAGVNTWSQNDELIFFTTPEVNAKVDVNVLAQAFNVSSADIQVRTIIVDELPVSTVANDLDGNVLGILADKDIIQAWDIINESAMFQNADTLTTNYFLHKQGIMASCKFAQMVIFHDGQKATV